MNTKRYIWVYKGVNIYPADVNASGIRWYAIVKGKKLRSDAKQGMRQLITATLEITY